MTWCSVCCGASVAATRPTAVGVAAKWLLGRLAVAIPRLIPIAGRVHCLSPFSPPRTPPAAVHEKVGGRNQLLHPSRGRLRTAGPRFEAQRPSWHLPVIMIAQGALVPVEEAAAGASKTLETTEAFHPSGAVVDAT
jgi:hypothetical protein